MAKKVKVQFIHGVTKVKNVPKYFNYFSEDDGVIPDFFNNCS